MEYYHKEIGYDKYKDELLKLPPKWMQGYSDITGISYLFNINFDIPTLYSQTIKDYAMKPLYRNLIDSLRIASGEEVVQNSFDLYEKEYCLRDGKVRLQSL